MAITETAPSTQMRLEENKETEIQKYLEELTRISNEVKERYRNGYYMQAVSSLAAIPNLHRVIHEECIHASQPETLSESTKTITDPNDEEQEYFGLYL